MARYRDALPHLDGGLFLTDGGIETTLIYHEGLTLPHFAAFHLLRSRPGRRALHRYFARYARVAEELGMGLVLESATWRANPDWGERLGYSVGDLIDANREAIRLLEDIRGPLDDEGRAIILSGCIGPRGDGYVVDEEMSPDTAAAYHATQAEAFAGSAADMVCAITMTHTAEAIGIVQAAKAVAMPAAISFTVDTDGRLPSGQALGEAIDEVDQATDGYVDYYMINCAHPTHFAHVVEEDGDWTRRIGGLRANASRKSHAELDAATELDTGDPEELGAQYARLLDLLPSLRVLGGCCGTDHRHIREIGRACSLVGAGA